MYVIQKATAYGLEVPRVSKTIDKACAMVKKDMIEICREHYTSDRLFDDEEIRECEQMSGDELIAKATREGILHYVRRSSKESDLVASMDFEDFDDELSKVKIEVWLKRLV